jgi:hypothetical protein
MKSIVKFDYLKYKKEQLLFSYIYFLDVNIKLTFNMILEVFWFI